MFGRTSCGSLCSSLCCFSLSTCPSTTIGSPFPSSKIGDGHRPLILGCPLAQFASSNTDQAKAVFQNISMKHKRIEGHETPNVSTPLFHLHPVHASAHVPFHPHTALFFGFEPVRSNPTHSFSYYNPFFSKFLVVYPVFPFLFASSLLLSPCIIALKLRSYSCHLSLHAINKMSPIQQLHSLPSPLIKVHPDFPHGNFAWTSFKSFFLPEFH